MTRASSTERSEPGRRLLPFARLEGRTSTVTRAASRWATWLPDVLLILLIAGLGWDAAGRYVHDGLFVFGDHPGQFMRFWYPLAVSVPQVGRVVDWNPLWYAGYPELQFYPPGHALFGLLLNALTLGWLSPERVYNLIPVAALALPAFTTFIFLRVMLARLGRWPARLAGLASALLAYTFTPMWGGTNSVPIGLMGERLAFGLVPLALLAAWRLVDNPSGRRAALAALLLAALVLMHPFHAPAVVVATGIYALALRLFARAGGRVPAGEEGGLLASPGSRGATGPVRTLVAWLLAWLLLALGLTAWWLLPLIVRQTPFAAALARTNLGQTLDWLQMQPTPVLAVAALPALTLLLYRRDPRARATVLALGLLIPLLVLGILFDTTVLFERLNFTALDPIRFIAEYYMAILLLVGAAVGAVTAYFLKRYYLLAAGLALLIVVAVQPKVDTAVRDFHIWANFPPHATAENLMRHPAFNGLWDTLRNDPAADGRVLFTSYYLQVAWPDGSTLPTAIKAMTPYLTGREIIGGTFSHWSPVARLLWVGNPWARLLPDRVELEDDRRLFGIPWARMDDATLLAAAQALNVTTIVADADDTNARAALDAAPHFERFWDNGYFYLYHVRAAPAWVSAQGASVRLVEHSTRRWVVAVDQAAPGATLNASMAYYPLWHASTSGTALPITADRYALQQVTLPAGGPYTVTFTYGQEWPETLGATLSAASLVLTALALAGLASRIRRRPRPAPP